jgi:hypothetical protein
MRQRASLTEECALTREERYGEENRGMNRRQIDFRFGSGHQWPYLGLAVSPPSLAQGGELMC